MHARPLSFANKHKSVQTVNGGEFCSSTIRVCKPTNSLQSPKEQNLAAVQTWQHDVNSPNTNGQLVLPTAVLRLQQLSHCLEPHSLAGTMQQGCSESLENIGSMKRAKNEAQQQLVDNKWDLHRLSHLNILHGVN